MFDERSDGLFNVSDIDVKKLVLDTPSVPCISSVLSGVVLPIATPSFVLG